MTRAASENTIVVPDARLLSRVSPSSGAFSKELKRFQADPTLERAPALAEMSGAVSAVPKRSVDHEGVWEEQLWQLSGAYAENTIRGYRASFRAFWEWCHNAELPALPASPETVARYVTDISQRNAPATIRHRMAAVVRLHCLLSLPNPVNSEPVRLALRRMHRARGQRQRQPDGMRASVRDRLLSACSPDLMGLRDRALIAIGYDTLCRRSELIALRVEDIADLDDSAGTILVRRSKTDPLGMGRQAYLSAPTMKLLQRWLAAAGLDRGPVFRSVYGPRVGEVALNSYTVTRVVKRLARVAGMDEACVDRMSGHSFRIGAALDMIEKGIALVPVMHAGGWKSSEMVLRYTKQIDVMKSGMAQLYRR